MITAAFAATQRKMEPAAQIERRIATAPVDYRVALAEMTRRNEAIARGEQDELLWLLEHPPVYTAGTSAVTEELLDPRFEVVQSGRGGRYTYHGPGQRVAYLLIDLTSRARDVRGYVNALEGWVIDTLAQFGVDAFRSEGRIGIWTRDIDGSDAKIGAIGVRIRRWVTMHGLAVNIAPELGHFDGIVPCGIADHGVTSLERLGKPVSIAQWDEALLDRFDAFLARLDQPRPGKEAP